jgi:hypothetical protein
MKDAETPLRSHISEATAEIERTHPTLAAGYQSFLEKYTKYLRLRRQFEPEGASQEKRAALASRLR